MSKQYYVYILTNDNNTTFFVNFNIFDLWTLA